MRRLVKEELHTFEGTRLFPERFAFTVQYELTQEEKDLYTAVTDYVRDEMNRRPDRGDRRRSAVGFALTTLQRRLASSPAAIHGHSNRRARLGPNCARHASWRRHQSATTWTCPMRDDLDDLTDEEREALEEKAIAGATASRTPEELETRSRSSTDCW